MFQISTFLRSSAGSVQLQNQDVPAGGERGPAQGQGADDGQHEPQREAGRVRGPRSHSAAGDADREGAPRGKSATRAAGRTVLGAAKRGGKVHNARGGKRVLYIYVNTYMSARVSINKLNVSCDIAGSLVRVYLHVLRLCVNFKGALMRRLTGNSSLRLIGRIPVKTEPNCEILNILKILSCRVGMCGVRRGGGGIT